MVTDENGHNHCNCKYCGGKPKVVNSILGDFIQCDDCQTSFANWEEYDAVMDNFQDRVVRVSDLVKAGDITNWDHPYGISYKKLNEVHPGEISTEVVRHGYWLPSKNRECVECSECYFQVKRYRAIELGVSNDDFIKVKYNRCPICGSRMHIKKKGN